MCVHARAIGAFINGSGLDKAWQVAEWFESSAFVHEIIQCIHIKQALAISKNI